MIKKTLLSTIINIIGMSVAFATTIILLVQVRWDFNFDRNFDHHENIFRIETNWMGGDSFTPSVSRPLIEGARNVSPNVEMLATCWIQEKQPYSPLNSQSTIEMSTARVDKELFDVFNFEWIEGTANDFNANNLAVISDEYAKMFFPNESAIGKVLKTTTFGTETSVTIVGVYKSMPKNCSVNFDILEYLGDYHIDDYSQFAYIGYLKLKDLSQFETTQNAVFQGIFKKLKERFDDGESPDETELRSGFRLVNLHDGHFNRDTESFNEVANRAIMITLIGIAILLIIIAIVNFINFSFAEIPFRIKNINTRKVLGESRASLIGRLLIRAGILATVSFALSCVVVKIVSISPWVSYVSDSLALSNIIDILVITFCIAIFSAIISGIAPALYATSQPAAIVLKGSYGTSVKGRALRKVLVMFQFVISFVFMLTALFVDVQRKYMSSQDMGFGSSKVLQIKCGYNAGEKRDAMSHELMQNPAIENVTFSDSPLVENLRMCWGRDSESGDEIYMEVLPVAENFVDFFDLQIVEGRGFEATDSLSETGCFIFNENFFNKYPEMRVGKKFYGHRDLSDIVGKVKDFNFKSLQNAITPLALYCWGKHPWTPFSVMYVKMSANANVKETFEYIQKTVSDFDPMLQPSQIEVNFLDNYIAQMYSKEQSLGKMINAASVVALLIAIIGIVGLVFFETQFLRKEIAVRRVCGATIGEILSMINKKYVTIALISFVVAVPLAIVTMITWRAEFAYQSSIPIWIFAVSLLIVSTITLAVVTLLSIQAAAANPVNSLKRE